MKMKNKTNYQITIGYKAVITVSVKAENEEEAKKKGLDLFKDKFQRSGSERINIEDDNFKVDGIVDMDRTWNMYDKQF